MSKVTRRMYGNPSCQQVMERIAFFLSIKPSSISHTIPDYASVVDCGLKAIKAEAEEKERALGASEEDQDRIGPGQHLRR